MITTQCLWDDGAQHQEHDPVTMELRNHFSGEIIFSTARSY